jgi:putative PEP-CTERM system TPR-repeat lipoprotein
VIETLVHAWLTFFTSEIPEGQSMRLFLRYPTIILTLSILTFFGVGCSADLTDSEYLARAQASYDEGEFSSTVIDLKNSLSKNPNNAQARVLLGKTYLLFGQGAEAEKELTRALELGLDRSSILPYLAKALLLQGEFERLLDETNLAEALDDINRATISAYRGNAWLALNEQDKARLEFENALALESNNALAEIGLARLLIVNGQLAEAESALQAVLVNSPQQAEAWSLLADLHTRKNEYEQAENAYTKAIEYQLLNQTDRANRALVYIAMQNFDSAAEDTRILKQEAPEYFATHYADGLLAFYQKNYAQAQSALETSLIHNPYNGKTYYYLGVSHLYQGQLGQALLNLSQFRKQNPGSVMAAKMLALTYFQSQEYENAREVLTPVSTARPDDVFTQKLMAQIELRLGNSDEAVERFTSVRDLFPESAMAHLDLGEAILTQGDTDKANRELEKALTLDPSLSKAEVMIIVNHLNDGDFDKAIELAEIFRDKNPTSATPLTLMAGGYMAKGDEAKAKALLEQALLLDPSDMNAARNLAKMEAAAGNLDKVNLIYNALIEQEPGNLEALVKLAAVKQQEGNTQEMVSLLERAIEENPKALLPRAVLGNYFLQIGQPGNTLSVTRDMSKYYPESHTLWALLGQAQLALEQPFDAVNSFEELAKLQPQSADAQYLLATAYSRINEPALAREALQKALQLKPQHVAAKYTLARIYSLEGDNLRALELAAELKADHPDSSSNYDLGGWLALRSNQPAKAVAIYKEASQRYPEGNLWPLKLSQAYWVMSDYPASFGALNKWLENHPEDARIRHVVANNYLLLGQLDEAQSAYSELAKMKPDDAVTLNNLAWLLRDKDTAKALAYAERAHELAPDWGSAADTLAMILLDKGDNQRAVSLLRDAHADAPANINIAYHLAQALVANGNTEAAKPVLNSLLESAQDSPTRQEAQQLLTEISQ